MGDCVPEMPEVKIRDKTVVHNEIASQLSGYFFSQKGKLVADIHVIGTISY